MSKQPQTEKPATKPKKKGEDLKKPPKFISSDLFNKKCDLVIKGLVKIQDELMHKDAKYPPNVEKIPTLQEIQELKNTVMQISRSYEMMEAKGKKKKDSSNKGFNNYRYFDKDMCKFISDAYKIKLSCTDFGGFVATPTMIKKIFNAYCQDIKEKMPSKMQGIIPNRDLINLLKIKFPMITDSSKWDELPGKGYRVDTTKAKNLIIGIDSVISTDQKLHMIIEETYLRQLLSEFSLKNVEVFDITKEQQDVIDMLQKTFEGTSKHGKDTKEKGDYLTFSQVDKMKHDFELSVQDLKLRFFPTNVNGSGYYSPKNYGSKAEGRKQFKTLGGEMTRIVKEYSRCFNAVEKKMKKKGINGFDSIVKYREDIFTYYGLKKNGFPETYCTPLIITKKNAMFNDIKGWSKRVMIDGKERTEFTLDPEIKKIFSSVMKDDDKYDLEDINFIAMSIPLHRLYEKVDMRTLDQKIIDSVHKASLEFIPLSEKYKANKEELKKLYKERVKFNKSMDTLKNTKNTQNEMLSLESRIKELNKKIESLEHDNKSIIKAIF